MLLLSAKCPRAPGRRESYLWKAIRRVIQRSDDSVWSNGRSNTILFPHETKQDFINLVRKSYQDFFFGHALIAGRIWKGVFLIAVTEELENMDASEVIPLRLNVKEVLKTQRGEECVSAVADGTAKL